jgi:hypothetical protein
VRLSCKKSPISSAITYMYSEDTTRCSCFMQCYTNFLIFGCCTYISGVFPAYFHLSFISHSVSRQRYYNPSKNSIVVTQKSCKLHRWNTAGTKHQIADMISIQRSHLNLCPYSLSCEEPSRQHSKDTPSQVFIVQA